MLEIRAFRGATRRRPNTGSEAVQIRGGKAEAPHHDLRDTGLWLEPSRAHHR
jgi:hypothetical protein